MCIFRYQCNFQYCVLSEPDVGLINRTGRKKPLIIIVRRINIMRVLCIIMYYYVSLLSCIVIVAIMYHYRSYDASLSLSYSLCTTVTVVTMYLTVLSSTSFGYLRAELLQMSVNARGLYYNI